MTAFWELEAGGDAPALIAEHGPVLSYKALAARADALVANMPPRSLFALECTHQPDVVAAYLGALRRGIVPLMVDTGLAPELKAALYDRFEVPRVFGPEGWSEHTRRPPALHPELGLLLSTSGSTGSPKLVRLSRANLRANADSIVEYLSIDSSDVAITSLPIHYSYGLSVLNSHLAARAPIVLTNEAVTTAAFWSRFKGHEVTNLAGVPTTWRLLRRMRFERMALPSLKTMTQAGGRLDAEEVRWMAEVARQHGRRFFAMYGQTEATARIAYLPPDRLDDKAGSIGIAIPRGRLSVVDDTGAVVPDDIEGELVYEGPNVMLGYGEQAADLALGRTIQALHTGDLGRRDSDGFYWITGRRKRFIKLFGNRFNLDDVEQQLRDDGLDAMVTGADDLLMIGIMGGAEEASRVHEAVCARYRLHHSAVRVQGLSALPRSSAGKPLHAELAAMIGT
ncbi:MAG TPA: AMP-binding protein [Burkholderiaceae bacterium]|nr:AMP-binding protein [Burkholderiaceae bacterium]